MKRFSLQLTTVLRSKAVVYREVIVLMLLQEALEAHTWNKNAAANWLLQGGSAQPQGPGLRRSTTDRTSYAPSVGSGETRLRFVLVVPAFCQFTVQLCSLPCSALLLHSSLISLQIVDLKLYV